jgi:hypothetical protein
LLQAAAAVTPGKELQLGGNPEQLIDEAKHQTHPVMNGMSQVSLGMLVQSLASRPARVPGVGPLQFR